MYPKYYKDSDEAKRVFVLINAEEAARRQTSNPLKKVPVRVDQLANRRLTDLSGNIPGMFLIIGIAKGRSGDCSRNDGSVSAWRDQGTAIVGGPEDKSGEQRTYALGSAFGSVVWQFVLPTAYHAGKCGTEDGRQPEQPELRDIGSAGEQRRTGASRRIDRGVGDRDQEQVNEGQAESRQTRPPRLSRWCR
jgi:hypothetical protein